MHLRHIFYLSSLRLTQVLAIILALATSSAISACGAITRSGMSAIGANVTPIRDLAPSTTPNQDNTMVYVQGKVAKHVPLVNKHAYQLDDSTGKIWVLTHQNGINAGSQIVIKGLLRYQNIAISGQELGELYLEEK